MRVAVVTVRPLGGEEGGAERLFDALVGGLRALGHDAEEVTLLTDESDFDRILENYLHFYDLDLTRFDAVISTKAPTWMVRHPAHACYLVHTIRVFYDMFDGLFPDPSPTLLQQRDLIHHMDTAALSVPACREVFAIGHEVSARLRRWNQRDAKVLHPPLWSDAFRDGADGDFLFLAGRLHPWKRIDLVVSAMRYVRSPIRFLVAGTGDARDELVALAGPGSNVEFLGRIDDHELVDYYSRAFAVPFTPMREDYGFVTLEAFASGKPVITCGDSGEAAYLVSTLGAGIVCEPDPRRIAEAIDQLYADAAARREMGAKGRAWVRDLSWASIAQELLDGALGAAHHAENA